MKMVIFSLLKANIIAVVIILISYVVESSTSLRLLVTRFKWKKNYKYAEQAANGNSGFYAILCTIVLIIDIKNGIIEFSLLNIFVWFIILVALIIIVKKLYFKFQGIDIAKKEDDFV